MRWLPLVPLAVCSGPLLLTDIREHRLPNGWNLLLAAGALVAHASTAWQTGTIAPVVTSLGIGLVGLLGLLAIHVLTRGGIGMGDVKLVGALGCFAADPFVLFLLVFAGFVLAGCWVVVGRVALHERIAFGPFLLFGTWLVVAVS